MLSPMLVAFFVYLTAILVIGLAATIHARKEISTQFTTGVRSVNWWVTAISAHAADMSDWLFMALPAAIYMQGMFNVWVALGLVFGMFLSWHFLAPALRATTDVYKTKTLPSYFEAKYQEKSGRISVLSAVIMAFFFTIYIAAGIKGVGYLLNTTFGLNAQVGGAITLSITLLYTLIGGFIAAAWVDFFQGIFLLFAVLVTSIVGFYYVGGTAAIENAATLSGVSLKLLPYPSKIIEVILGPFSWGLGYFGMPHILAKFMAAKDVRQMYKSKYIGVTWQILALFGGVLSGFVGLAFFTTRLANPELLFINMTLALFPAFIAGIILCGILSATLSTINAQMIVFAGVVADDLYKKWYRPQASAKEVIMIFRGSIITVALLSFIIAWFGHGTIFNLVQFAWGGLGASFGPLTLLSLYYTKINKHGAFWGILIGGTTAILWKIMGITLFGYAVNEVLPGFIAGIVSIILISAVTRKD